MADTYQERDWDAIQADYVAGMSYRQLADKYGIAHTSIRYRAKADGWEKAAVQVVQKTCTKLVNAVSSDRARKMARIINAADRMSIILDRVTEQLEEADKANAKNLRGLSDLAKAIATTSDTMRSLYGIPTQSQEHAQHMAEERLQLERERMEIERRKAEADGAGDDGVEVRWVMPSEEEASEADILADDGEVGADG